MKVDYKDLIDRDDLLILANSLCLNYWETCSEAIEVKLMNCGNDDALRSGLIIGAMLALRHAEERSKRHTQPGEN